MSEEIYEVIIPPNIYTQLENIRDYISNVFFAPQAANKRITEIFNTMESLKTFPERGFSADKKVGRQISKISKTYGIVAVGGKYLIFYNILGREINISYLIPTKSDYAKLFN